MLSSDRIASDLFDRDIIQRQLKYGLRTVNEAFQLWVVYNLLAWQRGIFEE